ncbi:MAG: class I SAM-dependent methyltransferase [Lachnospiraceae bacterium]|nr:class I SAM-dependent methyltransferase [Lachnospiraceae bacterium]
MMNSGHAKMAEWGFGFLRLGETDNILDIGCGGGANIAHMLKQCPKGTVKGIDYSAVSVEKSGKVNADAIKSGKCEVVCGSVMELPFEKEQFDVVTAFETVYFWPGFHKAFAQVYKVLKKDGTFFICNEACGKNSADEKWTKMIEGMVIYTSEQLKQYLEEVGFTNIEARENDKGWLCITAKK